MRLDEESCGTFDGESIDAGGNSSATFLIDDHETGPRGVCQRNDLGLTAVKLRDQQGIGLRGIGDPGTPSLVVEGSGTGPSKSADGDLPVDRPRDPNLLKQGRQQVQTAGQRKGY